MPAGHEVLLFSYFHHPGRDGLRLAYSRDGLNWTPLNGGQPLLPPKAGLERLMRDPFILWGPDGLFRMVWTTGWNERCIGYAWSEDLIRWSEQREIWVMGHEPGALNCWAPEIFYDEPTGRYLIYWSTTIPGRFPETDGQNGKNHRIYYTTTEDFEHFTEARLLYDGGFNVIDANIVRDGCFYVMFMKDETNTPFPPQKNIRFAVSWRPEGPYGPASPPITGAYWAEGPSAIKLDGWWVVYFDKHREGKYGAVRSRDLRTWEDISDQVRFPPPARHGAIFSVPEEILERLLRLDGGEQP